MVSYFEAPGGLGVKCDLIKPGDEIAIAFSVFDCPNEDIKVIVKQAEVDLKIVSSSDAKDEVLDILVHRILENGYALAMIAGWHSNV